MFREAAAPTSYGRGPCLRYTAARAAVGGAHGPAHVWVPAAATSPGHLESPAPAIPARGSPTCTASPRSSTTGRPWQAEREREQAATAKASRRRGAYIQNIRRVQLFGNNPRLARSAGVAYRLPAVTAVLNPAKVARGRPTGSRQVGCPSEGDLSSTTSISHGQRRLNMKKLARLASLLSLAVFVVGLMAASSASAIGYLLLPVGATITAVSLPGTLSAGGNTITCQKDNFTATIASVHLIGPFVVHFLECTATGGSKTCPLSSPGAASGLILTKTLHALIGLGLPGNRPALLILPATGQQFVTLEESTLKTEDGTTEKCTPKSTVNGTLAGLLLQGIGVKTTRALLDFIPGDPKKIDLPLGGNITPELEDFGVEGEFATQVHLSYSPEVELMP
jgi:hypothetical protein